MFHLYNQALQVMYRLNSTEWLIVLLVVCVFGFLSLRGFGSRSTY